jgi:hypothetical protein
MPIVLVAAVLSGLVATWVSILYHKREQIWQAKIRVFQELLGNRYVLLPVPHDAAAGAAFASAVNQIAVVFHDCDPVLNALRAFHEAIVEPSISADLKTKRLLELFKALAKHLSVNTELLGDNFFLQAFSLNQSVAQPLDFQFQSVRWQDGQTLITGSLRLGAAGQWIPVVLPAEFAGTLGCTLIELAALGRESEGQLRSTNTTLEIGAMGQDFLQRLDRRRAVNG